MFPTIKHLNDLLPFIKDNPQFRVAEQPNGTTVVCYMLQDEDTFSGDNEEFAKECRGITFDTATGKILSRTLHKFKNVGESDDTQPDLIPWERIVRVMDKRDGSMITPVLMPDGTIKCKTKKTFTSAEAIAATEFLHQIIEVDGVKDQPYLECVRDALKYGMTPTFEWTSPRFPIVLTYDKDELTLLHIRDNITGRYLSEAEMKCFMPAANPNLFPIVENLIAQFIGVDFVAWDYLRREAETRTGVEGWIIQADDGEMWKIKTKWYIDLHHSVTFTRWRDVARTVAEDKSDDLKAAFALTRRSIEPILEVERTINSALRTTEAAVNAHVGNGRLLNRTVKDMALAFKEHELFGLIMRRYRGQEVDYREWYLKNCILSWPLDVIPTSVQNEDTEE